MITLTNGVQIPENAVQLQTTAAIDGYYVTQPLRLVQYDETLPVAAVQLTYQNQPYIPPTGAELNVRMGKPDGMTVYNPCLGMDSSGIVYFAFTQQMTIVAGTGTLTVEITDSGVKNSAPIIAEIRPNPVPEGSIESADEFLTLQEILAEAEKWGQIVQTNAANIQQVVDNLEDIQNAAENAQAAAASAEAAQQAAQEALGFRTFFSAVTPDANGNLDPSRPMVVGPAASVEIESAGDRIESVTALGFTQQAGTGDPSPTNVRALTNGGIRLTEFVLDGDAVYSDVEVNANTVHFSTQPGAINPVVAVGYCEVLELKSGDATDTPHWFPSKVRKYLTFYFPRDYFGATDKPSIVAALNANPVKAWYQDAGGTGSLYAPIIMTSGEYRATCLPLTAPLCEGDSVVSWAKSGCDKVLVLDGTENWIVHSTGAFYAAVSKQQASLIPFSNFYTGVATATEMKNYAKSVQVGSAGIYIWDIEYNGDAEAFKAHLQEKYASGDPVKVWIKSSADVPLENSIPVSLETHQRAVLVLDGTESWLQGSSGGSNVYYLSRVAKPGTVAQCSHFTYGVNQVGKFDTVYGQLRFRVQSLYDTIDAWKAYLAAQYAAGTPVTIVYQLATPITYAHPTVVLEAATGDQLTYTITGQSGGQVSVPLKPFQDGGHAKTADNAASAQNADNATQFDGHAWSEVPGQAPVQSVNGKTGAVTLGAADVGAVPLNHTAVLADGIALKDGSPVNTPADIDQYTVLRIHSNYGVAVCSVPIKGGQTGFLPLVNGTSAPYINIAVVNISRTETQLTLETNAVLRLATTGITAPGTALLVYRIEGLV